MSDLYTLPSTLSVNSEVAELIRQVQDRYRNGTPTGNRRKNRRYPFHDAVVVHRANPQATELGQPMVATGRDISLWGLSFLTSERYKAGNHLVLGFHIEHNSIPHVVRMLAEVRHIEEQPDGQWVVGCEFRETLSEMST